MNPEIKARWVAALRSGEYQQGRGKLRHRTAEGPDQYCCLGVLSDLASQEGIAYWDEHDWNRQVYSIDSETEVLPDAVAKWAGVAMDTARLRVHGIRCEIYFVNDGRASIRPHTFAELADLIEEQL